MGRHSSQHLGLSKQAQAQHLGFHNTMSEMDYGYRWSSDTQESNWNDGWFLQLDWVNGPRILVATAMGNDLAGH